MAKSLPKLQLCVVASLMTTKFQVLKKKKNQLFIKKENVTLHYETASYLRKKFKNFSWKTCPLGLSMLEVFPLSYAFNSL